MAEQPKKYRSFTGILYPDSTAYNCEELLDKLPVIFEEWGYVLHDSDVLESGEVKKAHYHWVGRRKNPVSLKTIANAFGIPEEAIEFVKHGWRAAVRYLTHVDHEEKFQYDPACVVCSFDYGKFLVDDVSSEDMAKGIFNYLVTSGCTSTMQLTRWAIDNGYWPEMRRAFPLWAAIMLENKNEMFNNM